MNRGTDPADRTDRFERDEGGPTTKSRHPRGYPSPAAPHGCGVLVAKTLPGCRWIGLPLTHRSGNGRWS